MTYGNGGGVIENNTVGIDFEQSDTWCFKYYFSARIFENKCIYIYIYIYIYIEREREREV